jgi:Mce-associated membrane protein
VTAPQPPVNPGQPYSPNPYAPIGPYAAVPGQTGYPSPPPRRSGAMLASFIGCAVLIAALIAGIITFGVLWSSSQDRIDRAQAAQQQSQDELDTLKRTQSDEAKALEVAMNYAVGAATFDYRNLEPWRKAITTGTSPDLTAKMNNTVNSMNQLLQPLRWVSKGTPLDAAVAARTGSLYKVNTYVKVSATNAQAVNGRDVITVYTITLDQAKNWQITDVGGVNPGS